MPTYSPNLGITLITPGDESNTWGVTTNNNLDLIDQAVAGYVEVDVSGGDTTLTHAIGGIGVSNEAGNAILELTGSPTTAFYVFFQSGPSKTCIVSNQTSFTATLATVSGTDTVDIAAGTAQLVYCDGLNVYTTSQTNYTPNRALVTDAGGQAGASSITSSELSTLSGINTGSTIQAQLSTKAPTTTGGAAYLLANDGAGGFANVGVGAGLSYTGGNLQVSGGGTVVSVTASSPVQITGTSTAPNVQMLKATSSQDGYLASTDWSTFNAKAPATSGSSILYGNGSGGFSNVSVGTGLSFIGGTLSSTSAGGVTSVNGLTGAVSLNYSSVGAPSTSGSGASGTWNISILGSAASATTAVSASSATTASSCSGNSATATTAGSLSSGGSTFSYSGGTWQTTGSVAFSGNLNVGTNLFYGAPTGAGTALNVSSGSLIQRNASSLRYKENVADYTKGLTDALKLRPVTFNFISQPGLIQGGLIAEETDQAGFNEFINYDSDGAPESINYGNMVALLLNTVKELNDKIEALEAKVGA